MSSPPMDRLFVFLPLLSFFLLLRASSDAAISPQEAYWRTVFPTTPMPRAITERLSLDATGESELTSVSVGKGGVQVNTGKPHCGTTVSVGGVQVTSNRNYEADNRNNAASETQIPDDPNVALFFLESNLRRAAAMAARFIRPSSFRAAFLPRRKAEAIPLTSDNRNNAAAADNRNDAAEADNINYNANYAAEANNANYNINYAAEVDNNANYNINYAAEADNNANYNINYAAEADKRNNSASETQIHGGRVRSVFFLESNLLPGAVMTVHFNRPSASRAAFLPRREADAISFSSAKLPEILDWLSIKAGSPESKMTLSTLHACERPAAPGERKLCSTSLESMVDFSVANLGTRRVVAASTVVSKAGTLLQTYMIEGVRKAGAAEGRLVACHAQEYAYAVFYCHTSVGRLYTASLIGADGAKVEAVVVCHTDTAGWNPNHTALKALKVSPGTVPVCHFLEEDAMAWSRSK